MKFEIIWPSGFREDGDNVDTQTMNNRRKKTDTRDFGLLIANHEPLAQMSL